MSCRDGSSRYVNRSSFNTDVWVLGDSIPYWAGERARARNHENLGTGAKIGWYGIRGQLIADLIHGVQLKVLFQPAPRLVFLHLGGNDLMSSSNYSMFRAIKRSIKYLAATFPEANLGVDQYPTTQSVVTDD